MQLSQFKIIECPRDAMQGIHDFIPTSKKIEYINCLLKVGFDVLDMGSFVSPKAIPQMADTKTVIENLDLVNTKSDLLVIIANERGAVDASKFAEIKYLGFPFSISETFQLRNTNASLLDAFHRLSRIFDICKTNGKELVVYLSMGFGNPYGDEWSFEIVKKWMKSICELGIKKVQLSDTIGIANSASIQYLFSRLIPLYKDVEIGAHFHTTYDTWLEKIEAAYNSGCKKFDGTIKGYGGCPMAMDKLVGNMPSEKLIEFANSRNVNLSFNMEMYKNAMQIASKIM